MHRLTLTDATTLIEEALAEARRQEFAPLAIIVLDAGGHPIALHREDGASFLRAEIAAAKARGAIGMGYGSRELARRANAAPVFYASLFAVCGGEMATSPGGVLIRDSQGDIIGAAGASGDTGDADESCVIAGIQAVSLTADPGSPPVVQA